MISHDALSVDLIYIFVLENLLEVKASSWGMLWHFMVCYVAMFNAWLGKAF